MVDVPCSRVFLQKQKLILETKKRFPFYSGAFGAGKTILGCHKVIRECLENPHSVWLCASQTYPQLRDTVLVTFLQELNLLQKAFDEADASVELIKDYNRTELKIMLYNGSVVMFRSCEDFSKFKSLNLDGFFLDEPADVSQDVFNMLQGRLRGRHTKHHYGVLCGNPANKNCWLYSLFFEHPPNDDYFVVTTSSYDNSFLPDGYVSSLEASYDEDWTRRYLKGEWFTMEGLIYNEFDRDVHVGDYGGRVFNEYRAGLDYGFRNPSCLLVVGVDSDDKFFVVCEFYKSGLTISDLAGQIKEAVGPFLGSFREICGDPSAPAVIEEVGRFVRCVAGDNDVIAGISRVKALLRQHRLFIDRSCVNLIKELEGYHYEKDKGRGDVSELPVKKDDHAVDSLRYCLYQKEQGTGDFYVD